MKCSGVSGSVIVASVSHAPSFVRWYLLRLFGWTRGCGCSLSRTGVSSGVSASIELNWHYYVARVFMCGRLSHRAFGYDIFVPVKQAKLYSWDAATLKCVPQLQLPKLPLQQGQQRMQGSISWFISMCERNIKWKLCWQWVNILGIELKVEVYRIT